MKSMTLNEIELIKNISKINDTESKNSKRKKVLRRPFNKKYSNMFKKVGSWKGISDKTYEMAANLDELNGDWTKISAFFKEKEKNKMEKLEILLNENPNFKFIEENFNFFMCTITKKGTFIKEDRFQIEASFNMIGTNQEGIFIKLRLDFITKEEANDFSYDTISYPSNRNYFSLIFSNKIYFIRIDNYQK